MKDLNSDEIKKDVIINDERQSIDWHKTFFLERYLEKVNPLLTLKTLLNLVHMIAKSL